MHNMYEIIDYQGEGHDGPGTKQATCIDDEEEYVSLHDPPQEARYKVPHAQGGAGNTRTTVTNNESEVKGSSDCQVQKMN